MAEVTLLPSFTYQYSVFYQPDSEGGFVAFVPALPGCHSQGENLAEAEANIREAIAAYLESLRKHGEEIPVEAHALHGTVEVALA